MYISALASILATSAVNTLDGSSTQTPTPVLAARAVSVPAVDHARSIACRAISTTPAPYQLGISDSGADFVIELNRLHNNEEEEEEAEGVGEEREDKQDETVTTVTTAPITTTQTLPLPPPSFFHRRRRRCWHDAVSRATSDYDWQEDVASVKTLVSSARSPSSDYGWDEGPQQHSSSTESLAPSSAGFGGSTSTTTEERPQTTEARPAAQFSGVGSRGLRIGGTVAAALAVASLVCFWCALASL
ncbi:hypothetical protein VTH82DRAFT_2960 [Thermothelomyces myriococcoides]